MVLKVGDKIEDFTLMGVENEQMNKYTLSETAAQKPVLLLFYVYDFSPVCTTQACEINDSEFLTLNDDIKVFGLSGDGLYSHKEFSKQNNITYPLLTDEEKKAYEICDLLDENNERQRGMVLIDTNLTVQYSWVAEDNWDAWDAKILSEIIETAKTL